jgi:hypothetical protein
VALLLALAALGALPAQVARSAPEVPRSVGILQTEQNLEPPSYGGVQYEAVGNTKNHVTARDTGGRMEISDPGIAIVAYRLSVGSQNCTGGVGTGSCGFARFLFIQAGKAADEVFLYREGTVFAGEGNDTVRVVTAEPAFVHCGPGLDRAVVSAGVDVDADCEVVTRI